jgi:hypothetical protein
MVERAPRPPPFRFRAPPLQEGLDPVGEGAGLHPAEHLSQKLGYSHGYAAAVGARLVLPTPSPAHRGLIPVPLLWVFRIEKGFIPC